jgi:hypothetical protein
MTEAISIDGVAGLFEERITFLVLVLVEWTVVP